ncbi:MAG: hypothetical protein A2509_06060 [Candidatus Edwardsbacteria bacterium RIFOXYD12_FULL_50_11]|uniref:Outer membrane protein beta-barrel domain-containing protein n=1 Tax=Candidatus Edwardsbacteria bacterium GWF2_54_11 TaxID=1817851 RepID=A0A1F5R2W0_9BACT|nr:MAG: hypothetical protein A2502_10555 [Candidatus Edwardsbacteria bacterium RifOxyC12_full_54_24]OGF06726.1 MAG: hypothetical protein A2273_00510 [Candidatus Edwardsbacteria bacterium RifOxyA12_full_54_48]OGF08795.1 MAG: hypothetical protein A2024_00765 [Candidatus Edwardsbacteria bacterium GWF2_54_11]OGF10677.1 MAG: hypothetical protein A3K15_05875 [Candidatus Edwardsbacteria bacterium GWE2_54_12]OGF15458.1 MAG: hypothetical protein A2509_06060 [Candidatus Edwardsbacteria bacterium RIFOXYD1
MKRLVSIVMLLCLAASLVPAQSYSGIAVPSYNSLFNNNLIDMSRLSMQQSFSMSYLGTNNGSLVSNLYRNSMSYRLTDKLELNLDLAYRFTPNQFNSLSSFQGGKHDQGMFLPSFGMKYQPSKSFLIEFQYNQVDPYSYNAYPLNRRF